MKGLIPYIPEPAFPRTGLDPPSHSRMMTAFFDETLEDRPEDNVDIFREIWERRDVEGTALVLSGMDFCRDSLMRLPGSYTVGVDILSKIRACVNTRPSRIFSAKGGHFDAGRDITIESASLLRSSRPDSPLNEINLWETLKRLW